VRISNAKSACLQQCNGSIGVVRRLLNAPQGRVAKMTAGSLSLSLRLHAIHTASAMIAMVGIA
jgi:hypothetical protein